MYILQNAIRNILRNQGRNLLIGAMIFVIIIASVVALMINNTTGEVIEDYKERFGAEVSLVVNGERLRQQAMEESTDGQIMMVRPVIPAEQYVAFGDSEYLQGSYYSASVGLNNDDLNVIDEELGGGTNRRGGGMGGGAGVAPSLFMIHLLGNHFEDFEEGLREMAEGRAPENENEAIISKDLAELNDISIGDTLQFTSELMDNEAGIHGIQYTLTIVGTYYDITDEYSEGVMQNAFTNRRNEILTNYETVIAPMQPDMSGINITATYYLHSPDYLEAFADEVYAKGLDPVFDVKTDEASYNKIVGPVEGLKSISITFLVIVLIFGGIIIALLSSIAIRERKYEIGVLRAMGMKKHKVALGLWYEMFIITSICLIIGLTAGYLIAQPVTNLLLNYQIEAAELASVQSSGPMMMGGMGNIPGSNAEPLQNIDITLGIDTLLQIIGIALLLASLAGFVSISKITKYEPIKILMERN